MNKNPGFLRLLLGLIIFSLVPGLGLRAAEISVQLENPPESGTVALVLFDSANSFGDLRDPYRVVTFELDGRDTYLIEEIPSGEYALMVYYDENKNQQMDQNFIGIPKEPLGFSNNYQPKGPPSYSRASFVLTESETRDFDVELYRPLGKRGRLGVGIGVIGRGSPYKGYDGGVFQIIPAITYTGGRLQVFGPNVGFGLLGTGKVRLAATGSYRIGVYEEDESDYLTGMGDREDTFMGGLAVQAELPGGFDVSLSYQHDLLDNIGGGEARFSINKSFQFGVLRLSPELGFNWLSEDLGNHDFGVAPGQALFDRPAYELSSTTSLDVGIGLFYEITTDWLVITSIAAEFFDEEITDSPIVEEDYVLKGFFAINYVF